MAAPVVTDWLEVRKAEESIQTVTTVVESMTAQERAEFLEQAHAWNESLYGGVFSQDEITSIWPHEKQLSFHDSPMMSWIEIPRIHVKEPVYHGTDDAALSAGVGHLETSGLPVGGSSTHMVLAAHSGIPTQRMFDDIHNLEIGDVFILWTMGDPYAYEVTGSEIVLPEEAPQYLGIEEGADVATLITCTPYGVNSHRLLVHGKRCEYVPQENHAIESYVNSRTEPLLIAFASLFTIALVFTVVRAIKRKHKA